MEEWDLQYWNGWTTMDTSHRLSGLDYQLTNLWNMAP